MGKILLKVTAQDESQIYFEPLDGFDISLTKEVDGTHSLNVNDFDLSESGYLINCVAFRQNASVVYDKEFMRLVPTVNGIVSDNAFTYGGFIEIYFDSNYTDAELSAISHAQSILYRAGLKELASTIGAPIPKKK